MTSSLYQSAANAQNLIERTFRDALESHLAALAAININNAVAAAAVTMLVQAATAPRTVLHDQENKPIGVMPILSSEE